MESTDEAASKHAALSNLRDAIAIQFARRDWSGEIVIDCTFTDDQTETLYLTLPGEELAVRIRLDGVDTDTVHGEVAAVVQLARVVGKCNGGH